VFQTEVLEQVIRGFSPDTKVYEVTKLFAEKMLEPIMLRYSLYPAKGTTIAHFAHNSDQMMLTHILNGLFPTLTLIYEAQKRGLYRLSLLSVEDIKVYVASYAMHDLDKILGDTRRFHTHTKAAVADAYSKLAEQLDKLQARAFLPNLDECLPEILWLAANTQRARDINLSHTAFIEPGTTRITDELIEILHVKTFKYESILRDLCTLSDLLAFFVKSPEDAILSQTALRGGSGIRDLIHQLTGREHFSLAYHKLAETRGFLSNQINNATMRYMSSGRLYPKDQEPLIPYLYLPNGVVYLNPLSRPVPEIDRNTVNELVEAELREACNGFLEDGVGLGFDPKGRLSYPGYFHDFLDLKSFLSLVAKKAISESRVNIAENTLQAMKSLQERGTLPADIKLDYVPDRRISQLGRFLLNYVDLFQKNLDKKQIHLKEEIERRLIVRFGEQLWNEAKRIPSSGGVDYRYYWLAAQYLVPHPLAEYEQESPGSSLEGLFQQCIDDLLEVAGKELALAPELQGVYLADLTDYLGKNLSFGFSQEGRVESLPDFAGELERYVASKRPRGSLLSCTICNSAYTTRKQEDASVLFQPWVYKNRLLLYKGENAGGICSICSLELMLRQLLLKDRPGKEGRINVKGKEYEDLELKYFFLYPGFFFTNQTSRLISYIIDKMKDLKLYELCEALRASEQVDASTVMSLSFFDITARSEKKAIQRNENEKKEREEAKGSVYLREEYDSHQYPGFMFFAKKTYSKRKKSDEKAKASVSSWVEAAWLGLALPLITGSRVVVTEAYLPLYNSAADFLETVILDAPHQTIRYLLPQSSARLRLDELYGDRRRDGDHIGGAMRAMSRAIELHIDTERVAGDLKLERFPRIARLLADDQLFIFSFLKEQVRRDKLDHITFRTAEHYNDIYRQFFTYYCPMNGGIPVLEGVTRHEEVTELYLQFYKPFRKKDKKPGKKGGWPNSHAIVRPIDIAAKSILKDTLNLTPEEIKLEMVQALESWLDIVEKGGATGQTFKASVTRRQMVRAFVEVFYNEVFLGYAEGRRSVLNSRLNRFKGGCEEAFSLWVAKKRKVDQGTEELPEEDFPSDEEESDDDGEGADL
jgi:CRISPR-associated protein Csc3